MSRSMVSLIHADEFFPGNDAENLRSVVENMNFVQMPYGMELPNFNLIFPDSEIIFKNVLGERVKVDPLRSGIIRKPNNNRIHFEQYDSPDEWCFIVALEPTTINLWHHIDAKEGMGELAKADAKHAMVANGNYNFNNLFEWKIHTNIRLEANQCLFIRPWVFHSLEDGLVQYYRLIADKNFRILVMGMPGSKKDSISQKLATIFDNATLINSMQERIAAKDVDFTEDGQLRHCYRMLGLARQTQANVTVIDMACPLPKMREILNPDIIIWVSDLAESKFTELNKIYVAPVKYDIECCDDSEQTLKQIIKKIISKRF